VICAGFCSATSKHFAPDNLTRHTFGEASVTHISEPILNQTTTVTRSLWGEGVRTGARVLVTQAAPPRPWGAQSVDLGTASLRTTGSIEARLCFRVLALKVMTILLIRHDSD
jgi:hypothetical protein